MYRIQCTKTVLLFSFDYSDDYSVVTTADDQLLLECFECYRRGFVEAMSY